MWVTPESPGLAPAYAAADVSPVLGTGRWVLLASGRASDGPAVVIRQPGACLRVARLSPGQVLALPSAPYAYVHVTRGAVELAGCGPLAAGDAALVTAAAGQRIAVAPGQGPAAGADVDTDVNTDTDTGTGTGAAEVLVWEMQSSLFGPPPASTNDPT
jgi:hypothetical protein